MSRNISRRRPRCTPKFGANNRRNSSAHFESSRSLVYDAVLQMVSAGQALLLDRHETSHLLVLRSGEAFSLDRDGITRLG